MPDEGSINHVSQTLGRLEKGLEAVEERHEELARLQAKAQEDLTKLIHNLRHEIAAYDKTMRAMIQELRNEISQKDVVHARKTGYIAGIASVAGLASGFIGEWLLKLVGLR